MKALLAAAALGLTTVLGAGVGQAEIIHGTVWQNVDASNQLMCGTTASPTCTFPAGTPTAKFTTGADGGPAVMSWDTRRDATPFTPMGFLNSGTAPNNLNPPGFMNVGAGTFIPTAPLSSGAVTTGGTEFRFTGTLGLQPGDTNLMIAHDDGVALFLSAGAVTNLNSAGPTPPVLTAFTITNTLATAQNFDFTLIYSECCGAPAVLDLTLPAQLAVPEPASLALLGSALVGLGVLRRRRRTS